MKILITDLTEMAGNNYCVAGWESANQRMVRPLPGGANWPQSLIAKHQIRPGTVLTVTEAGTPTGAYPHLTEDTPVEAASISATQSAPDWLGTGAPAAAVTISMAFGNNLQWNKVFRGVHQGVYVPTNTQCSSLAAVNVLRGNVSFVQPFGKLLAIVNDGSAIYQLAVSSHKYKGAWREGGVDKATALLPNRWKVHVRIGLAREFEGQPNRCYLMVNEIL